MMEQKTGQIQNKRPVLCTSDKCPDQGNGLSQMLLLGKP